MNDKVIKRYEGIRLRKVEKYRKGDLTYLKNRTISSKEEADGIDGKLIPKSSYEKLDEALTQTRKKLVKASVSSVKKSGETMLNTVSLGNYKRIRQTRIKKKEKQNLTYPSHDNDKNVVRKENGLSSVKKRNRKKHPGNLMTKTIAFTSANDIQSDSQESLNNAAQVATTLVMKMMAMTLMAVKIAAKLALLVVTAAVSLVVVAVSSIVGIIIAIVVVFILIVAVVSMVASDTGGDDTESGRIGMYSFESVYSDLEKQYENKIISLVDIGRNAGCESYQIEGEKAEAEDVLAVYLASDTANGYGTFDADTLWFVIDTNGIILLTEIYWKINEIEYSIEADESGPKKMLIKARAKDKEIAAGEYNAENQLESVSAHYFHLFNMIRNAEQDGRYVLPIGEKSY